MSVNESNLERVLRILIGLVLISLAVGEPRTMWGLLGVFPLLTGADGYCPIYRLLGWSHASATHWI